MSSAHVETKMPPRLARVSFTGKLLSMTRRRAGELVRGQGGEVASTVSRRTTLLVVGMGGWPLLDDGSVSRKLRRAETLNAAGAAIEIAPESAFLELVGLADEQPALEKTYDATQVCDWLGLDPAVLRRWEVQGLIESHAGQYDFRDIISLQTIADLIGRGVAPAVIARSVRGLSTIMPDTDRPLAQLKLVEASGELCAEIGDAFLAPDGQLGFMFEGKEDAVDVEASVLTLDLPEAATHWSAENWFDAATAAEEDDRFEAAIESYRQALAIQPQFPEAHFNLGNALRAIDRLDAAEAHFQLAVGQDSMLAPAWYNLADVQEELGWIEAARASLHAALVASPEFTDAHFNLALCCERLGDLDAARASWRAYLRLDPGSVWASQARAHLAALG